MFDYETIKFIWWLLIGVLLIGFALFDGVDMGSAILLPFAGKTDQERRTIINTIAPHWDGNQVWLITAGGAIFAAWPLVYATAFSGLYWALLLVLFALFLRPVGFDYRSKLENPTWRNAWDWGLFVGGFVPALVFGVAFGNLFLGLPFYFDGDFRSHYSGSFFALLNPFALLVGLVSASMIAAHGGTWLSLRAANNVTERSRKLAIIFSSAHFFTFVLAGIILILGIKGWSTPISSASSNGFHAMIISDNPGWQANFKNWHLLYVVPIITALSSLAVALFAYTRFYKLAFLHSSLAITGTIATAGIALFPFLMPSSVHLASSLTLWNATSSKLTLTIMFGAACFFVPIILLYTAWGYYKMWGRITTQQIDDNSHGLY